MRYAVALIVLFIVLLPFTTRSQEEIVEETVSEPEAATTTEPIATSTANETPVLPEETATSTTEAKVDVASTTEEESGFGIGEVLGDMTSAIQLAVAGAQDKVEEFVEEVFEESIQPIISTFRQQLPRLTIREFKKNITVDQGALHSCKVEPFRVILTDKKRASAGVFLTKDADISFAVEIGALPKGINIYFSDNNDYKYLPGTSETMLELSLVNETGSQKGDFNIPIIFTKKNVVDSPVICQINVANL